MSKSECTSWYGSCPVCAGEVLPTSQAAQDLAAGVLQAEAQSGLSRFWKTHLVAEVYRRGPHRPEPMLDEFVLAGQAEATRWGTLLGAGFDGFRIDAGWFLPAGGLLRVDAREDGEGESNGDLLPEGDGGEGRAGADGSWPALVPFQESEGEFRSPPVGPETGGLPPGCCVKDARYPESVGESWESVGDDRMYVGFAVRSRLQYHDEIARGGLWCLCECCVFKQWVRYVKKTGTGLSGTREGTEEYWEDCRIETPDGSWVWVPREAAHRGAYPRVGEGDRVHCLGTRGGTGFEGGQGTCEAWEDKPDEKSCEYRIRDYPGLELLPRPGGTKFRLEYDFIGRVFDRCRDDAIRWTGRFRLFASGSVQPRHPTFEQIIATRDMPPTGNQGTSMPIGEKEPCDRTGVC